MLSVFVMIVIALSVLSFTLESTPTGCTYLDKWQNFSSGELCDEDCQGRCDDLSGNSEDLDAAGCTLSEEPTKLCEEQPLKPSPFYEIEFFCIMVFSIEYIGRLLSCASGPPAPGFLRFLVAPMNLIDLLAIVPWYIDRIQEATAGDAGGGLKGLAVLRILRLTRVMRIFKMSRNFRGLVLLLQTFKKSAAALIMLVFFVAMSLIVFATLIYYAEMGVYDVYREQYVRPDGSPTPFESIPTSMWWCIVTMTTVGYGDDYPTTMGGKMVAILTMFCGLIVLSLPITIIGANFDELYREERKKESEKKAEKAAQQKAKSPSIGGAFGVSVVAARLKGGFSPKGKMPTGGNNGEQPLRRDEPLKRIQELITQRHSELAAEVEELMLRQEEQLRKDIKAVLLEFAGGKIDQATPLDSTKATRDGATATATPTTPSNTSATPSVQVPPA